MQIDKRLLLTLVGLCLVSPALVGCGNSGPRLTPVEGVVTVDGNPIEGATVLFEPEAGGRPATGVTDAQGKFSLTVLDEGDGAHLGMNRVSVAKEAKVDRPSNLEEGEYADVVMETPLKYASPKTSGLTWDVKPGMDPVELKLESEGGGISRR